jgi:hypothetical protein
MQYRSRYLPDLHLTYARRGGVDRIVQASKQHSNQTTLRESTHNKYAFNASPGGLNASLGSTRNVQYADGGSSLRLFQNPKSATSLFATLTDRGKDVPFLYPLRKGLIWVESRSLQRHY